MTLQKIKQPVEYSFLQWINGYPDSGHWADKERFLIFAKTVCRYNATRWKKPDHLRNRILKAKPNFDSDLLDHILDLYTTLIGFYKAVACPTTRLVRGGVRRGLYIEIGVKKGKIYKVELPLT